jgi:hypothetical protein
MIPLDRVGHLCHSKNNVEKNMDPFIVGSL